MDGPALRKRHGLVTVRLGTEKGSDLIEDEVETRGSGEGFEPARRPVALLDTPMVLLNGLITNDKFCLSRLSQVKLRWSRRPYRFRPRKSDDAPDDIRHWEGSHETSLAHTASIPADGGWGTTVGSGLPIPTAMDDTKRAARRTRARTTSQPAGGGLS
jgi:hypothetical protein